MFYYNGNGEQVSSLSGEVEKSESSSPTNNTPQDPSISGGPTGQNNTPNAPNANTNENDKSAKTQNLNNKNNNTIVLLEIKHTKRTVYYVFIVNGKKETTKVSLKKSEEEFYNLDSSSHPKMKDYGKYGIAEYYKTGVPSHYMLLRREQHDRINPSDHDDYTLKGIRFVFFQDIKLK